MAELAFIQEKGIQVPNGTSNSLLRELSGLTDKREQKMAILKDYEYYRELGVPALKGEIDKGHARCGEDGLEVTDEQIVEAVNAICSKPHPQVEDRA
jgi:hypothetical protein